MADFSDTKVSLAGQGTLIGRVVSTVQSDAVLVTVAGVEVVARVVAGLSLSLGDNVLILRHGSDRFAINVVKPAPATRPTIGEEPGSSPASDAPPPTKLKVTTGKLVVLPVQTADFRNGRWRSDGQLVNSYDTYQGDWGNWGRNTGCAFYGTKPRTLKGATVTRATVHLRRLFGGVYGGRAPTLRLLTQALRPGGAPTLNESTAGPSLTTPNLGSNQTVFTIPDSWGQLIVGGTRGGIGIQIADDDPYIRLAGKSSWSAAWTLTLYWRRSS